MLSCIFMKSMEISWMQTSDRVARDEAYILLA